MITASGRRAFCSSAAAGGEPEAPPPYRESPPPSSPIRMHSGSGQPSSVHTRASAGGRSYPRRATRAIAAHQAGLNCHYSAVIEALESPPAALASLGSTSTAAAAHGGDSLSHRPRRGTPLVQWVWPSNASASVIAKAGSSESNSNNNSNATEGMGGRGESRCYQENAKRRMMPGLHQRGRQTPPPPVVLSGVVTGKICEPVRPTRLDLSANQGYPLSSRVVYTAKAKGRHAHNPADVPSPPRASTASAAATAAVAAASAAAVMATPRTPLSIKPPALKLPLSFPLDVPWLDSAGRGGGGGGGGGSGSRGRGRAYSSNSATAAGLPSPRYLQSTTVSQAKAVEPAAKKRPGSFRTRRASLDGSETDGGSGRWAGGVGWAPGGMLESLGGFLGIGKGSGGGGEEGTAKGSKRGKAKRHSRGGERHSRGSGESNTGSRGSIGGIKGGGKAGSKGMRRGRKSHDGERENPRHTSARVKMSRALRDGCARAPSADGLVPALRATRRDERDILTMHTHGVLKPEGVKLRVVKASGRALEDTKFHMEIRTLRPGQVWSVCRRHRDFRNLHSCLQGRFPALVLPRLPRSPPGGVALEPATLERTRAGLQAYVGSLVSSVPAAWGVEEFVMFLDSDEKGRRLFARKRKKETRRLSLQQPLEARHSQAEEPKPTRSRAHPSSPASHKGGPPAADKFHQKSLLDLKEEETNLALAALEGAAQNHFDGTGAVMNPAVSFSEDEEDSDFDEGADFIDGEDAIREMLDRDAEEAADDNLFSIPAGTDFGAPPDDDDDDIGDGFDITYHG